MKYYMIFSCILALFIAQHAGWAKSRISPAPCATVSITMVSQGGKTVTINTVSGHKQIAIDPKGGDVTFTAQASNAKAKPADIIKYAWELNSGASPRGFIKNDNPTGPTSSITIKASDLWSADEVKAIIFPTSTCGTPNPHPSDFLVIGYQTSKPCVDKLDGSGAYEQAFGNVPVGTSVTKTVQITNNGSGALKIVNIRCMDKASWTPSKIFTSGPTTPFTLAVGASQTVTINYVPSKTGADEASLIVSYSGCSSADDGWHLTGTGVAQPACASVSMMSVTQGGVALPIGTNGGRKVILIDPKGGAVTFTGQANNAQAKPTDPLSYFWELNGGSSSQHGFIQNGTPTGTASTITVKAFDLSSADEMACFVKPTSSCPTAKYPPYPSDFVVIGYQQTAPQPCPSVTMMSVTQGGVALPITQVGSQNQVWIDPKGGAVTFTGQANNAQAKPTDPLDYFWELNGGASPHGFIQNGTPTGTASTITVKASDLSSADQMACFIRPTSSCPTAKYPPYPSGWVLIRTK